MPENLKAKIEKRYVQVGDGLMMEVEQHPGSEEPKCYPDSIVNMGEGVIGLMDIHSEYYEPTPAKKAELRHKLKGARSWCYLRLLKERERV